MNGVTRLGWMAFAIAIAILVTDQAVKTWVLDVVDLQEGQSIAFFGPIHLTGVWNHGVSFGFLQAQHDLVRWLLVAFSIGVSIFLGVWVRKSERPLFAVAVGLLMGGAIGNVIDRIRIGAVADFIDAQQLFFPWIFNVADSAISIGICLLLLDMLIQDGRERAARTAGAGGNAA